MSKLWRYITRIIYNIFRVSLSQIWKEVRMASVPPGERSGKFGDDGTKKKLTLCWYVNSNMIKPEKRDHFRLVYHLWSASNTNIWIQNYLCVQKTPPYFSLHPPAPLSARGGRLNLQPNIQKRGIWRGPQLLEGVAGKEWGDFFHIKNNLKPEIFNDKKSLYAKIFFSVITKNSNWEILLKNLGTFKR